jgi:rod shape-determining protein MreD
MMGERALQLVIGYALTVLQASLQALVPVRVLVPELGFLVALYVGLSAKDDVAGACAVALVLGYVTDLLAGAPKGLHALVFALACLAAKAASLRLLLRGALVPAAFTFLVSLAGAAVVVGTRAHFGEGSLRPLAIAPLQAAMTALACPLVFGMLARARARRTAAQGRR